MGIERRRRRTRARRAWLAALAVASLLTFLSIESRVERGPLTLTLSPLTRGEGKQLR